MKKQVQQLSEFHAAFGGQRPLEPSLDISPDLKALRITLMQEELKEVVAAINEDHPLPDLAKELADLLYVLLGTVHTFGLDDHFATVFDEVHRSNMSKLDDQGQPIYRKDGKVLKSKNYTPANIAQFFEVDSQ